MFAKRPVFLLFLFVGATVGQILTEPQTSTDLIDTEKFVRAKGDVLPATTKDLQPAAS